MIQAFRHYAIYTKYIWVYLSIGFFYYYKTLPQYPEKGKNKRRIPVSALNCNSLCLYGCLACNDPKLGKWYQDCLFFFCWRILPTLQEPKVLRHLCRKSVWFCPNAVLPTFSFELARLTLPSLFPHLDYFLNQYQFSYGLKCGHFSYWIVFKT